MLNYVILKYPKSEDKEVNQTFKNEVREVNNLSDNNNDLVYRSGIKFEYREDQNYNSKIMEFLNYVVSLPDQKIMVDGKELELEETFHKELKNFFQGIESQKKLEKMKFNEKEEKKRKKSEPIDQVNEQEENRE